jgi:hypothetical protein
MVKGGLLEFDGKWSTLEHLGGTEFVVDKYNSICKAALGPRFLPDIIETKLRRLKVL